MLNFPWVPPHVHFMVWLDGVPVDPFLRDGEDRATAVWREYNAPAPPRPQDATDEDTASILPGRLTAGALERAVSLCREEQVCSELRQLSQLPAEHDFVVVATLEELLHHERWAFHFSDEASVIAPRQQEAVGGSAGPPHADVLLSLPLSLPLYRGAALV